MNARWNGLLIFAGLALVAGAIVAHAVVDAGKNQYSLTTAWVGMKLNTRTGELWACDISSVHGCFALAPRND
jgi:hypothetical protein